MTYRTTIEADQDIASAYVAGALQFGVDIKRHAVFKVEKLFLQRSPMAPESRSWYNACKYC